jgi:DnaJ homolog subfamily C member 19
MATAIAIGVATTVAALAGRAALRTFKQNSLHNISLSSQKFLRGGFEAEMSSREACEILGIKPSSLPDEVKKRHRILMMNNHPDRGGSPYIAGKVNEAKEVLEGRKRF